jgi:hypothetical protein
MAKLIHKMKLHVRADHGPAPAAVCSLKYLDDMNVATETVSLVRVNCPDCISRLAWVDQDYDGKLHMHWPFPLDSEPAKDPA